MWQGVYLWRLRALRGVEPRVRAWAARAARGGRTARRVWWAVLVLAGLGLLAVQALAATAVVHWRLWDEFPESFSNVWEDVVEDEYGLEYAVAWGVAAAVTLVQLVVLRLVWLRAGAKRALMRRDRCAACGHGLAGVPVDEAGLVRCPECAVETPAAVEWGEIDRSGGERAVFAPARGLASVFWTGRRAVMAGKVCAALALLCALGYGGWWGVREVRIRREAGIARGERADFKAINAERAATKPTLEEGQRYRCDVLRELIVKHDALLAEFMATGAAGAAIPSGVHVDASWAAASRFEFDSKEEQLNRYYSTKFVAEFLPRKGFFEEFDRIVDAPLWHGSPLIPIDGPSPNPDHVSTRKAIRLCIARMHVARSWWHAHEYVQAARSAGAIIEHAASGPLLIDWLVASGATSEVDRKHRESLLEYPAASWLATVEEALACMPRIDMVEKIRMERTFVLDSIAWYFSEPGRVREGLDAPMLRNRLGVIVNARTSGNERQLRLGGYSENRDAMAEFMDTLIAFGSLEPVERPRQGLQLEPPSTLAIVDFMSGVLPKVVESNDVYLAKRRATQVMLSLEKHRLVTGGYPASLEEMPRESAARTLLDPFSGRLFGYRQIDPARDEFKREYLLWTVGIDGEDNGGDEDHQNRGAALRPGGKGKDTILNDPRW